MDKLELEEYLKLLNKQWMSAYINHDIEFLNSHMLDSYVGTFPDGSIHNKQGEIESVKSGLVTILKWIQLHNGN